MKWTSIQTGGVALALMAAALQPSVARGQDVIVVSPKAVATKFLNAVTAGHWATVTRLTDEQSRWEYATQLRAMFRDWRNGTPPRPTVEGYMQSDSLMPRAVAEYMVSQFERSFRTEIPTISSMLADVERREQVDSLPDDELLIRRLRAAQMSYQVALATKRAGCATAPAAPQEPEPTRRVRGVAILAENEAVALYEEGNGMPGGRSFRGGYAQLALRRTSTGWRVVASDELMTGGVMGMAVSVEGCPVQAPPR